MAPKYPAIPEPTTDPASLRDAVLSLKQAFEILSGQRGVGQDAALVPSDLTNAVDTINSGIDDIHDSIGAIDGAKVNRAGDTMTGHLSLPVTPAAANAVRKDYVDTAGALKVDRAGDTMTGHLSLPITPAAANAVRKDYVDAGDSANTTATGLKVAKAGDVMTGGLTVPQIAMTQPASGIEMGLPGTISTPFIDFHSGATANDYDARITASGGVAGAGGGHLTFIAGDVLVSNGAFGVGAVVSGAVGDISTVRTTIAPTTGVVWFGNQAGGSRYLHYDGANFQMPSVHLSTLAGRLWGTSDFASLPALGSRLLYVGDVVANNLDPILGAVVVGFQSSNIRLRAMQLLINGTYVTASTA